MPSPTQSLFRLVLARPAQTAAGDHTTLVHLAWFFVDQSPTEHLIRVFLDGQPYATLPATPQQAWLALDRATPHTLELLAVPVDQADQDPQRHLKTWSPPYTMRPRLELPRDPDAPINATFSVAKDDGQTLASSLVWPADVARGGFGSLFGVSPFGHDNAASPGLGLAPFGHGPLDLDAPPFMPNLPLLQAGTHTLSLTTSHQPDSVTQLTLAVDPPLLPPLPATASP